MSSSTPEHAPKNPRGHYTPEQAKTFAKWQAIGMGVLALVYLVAHAAEHISEGRNSTK
ncbi:MAG: hypothetical protein V4437_00420 [Patescibacteria group bacterium]